MAIEALTEALGIEASLALALARETSTEALAIEALLATEALTEASEIEASPL